MSSRRLQLVFIKNDQGSRLPCLMKEVDQKTPHNGLTASNAPTTAFARDYKATWTRSLRLGFNYDEDACTPRPGRRILPDLLDRRPCALKPRADHKIKQIKETCRNISPPRSGCARIRSVALRTGFTAAGYAR